MTTLCISGAALFKAGANVSTALTGAQIDSVILQVESEINATTRYNWNDNYATLNADVKYILEQAASNLAAMYLVTYDMSGYTSKTEAQTILDVLLDGYRRAIKELTDIKNRDFVIGA